MGYVSPFLITPDCALMSFDRRIPTLQLILRPVTPPTPLLLIIPRTPLRMVTPPAGTTHSNLPPATTLRQTRSLVRYQHNRSMLSPPPPLLDCMRWRGNESSRPRCRGRGRIQHQRARRRTVRLIRRITEQDTGRRRDPSPPPPAPSPRRKICRNISRPLRIPDQVDDNPILPIIILISRIRHFFPPTTQQPVILTRTIPPTPLTTRRFLVRNIATPTIPTDTARMAIRSQTVPPALPRGVTAKERKEWSEVDTRLLDAEWGVDYEERCRIIRQHRERTIGSVSCIKRCNSDSSIRRRPSSARSKDSPSSLRQRLESAREYTRERRRQYCIKSHLRRYISLRSNSRQISSTSRMELD